MIENLLNLDEIIEFKKLKNLPKKLYFKGDLSLLKKRKISVVGSRKMSFYTKNLILNLTRKITKTGKFCVVSGAALGCDIIAHTGAFPNTIAVFGNGLDQIYPKENEKMIKQIYENALAISEYEPNQMPTKWSFLERNRLVVALGEALIVAQADLRSGSLQSARLANELGIPVFVFPQKINESKGTNLLLGQNRANLIYDIDEFCAKFLGENVKNLPNLQNDEILNFIMQNADFSAVLAKFGDRVYEYELDGKIEIFGTKVVVK
ncbi:MAG: DNA-protecting protein DprA [Campylobacter sp.]|nr:DNA-protecting protein DprA [Campylobacter sp.]